MSENYSDILLKLKGLGKSIKDLEAQSKTISKDMNLLEAQGLIYASIHFRDEKYMYLIYPMVSGNRKRDYVGCNPQKIAEAKAGIERGERYNLLKGQLGAIRGQMRGACYYIDLAESSAA